MKLVQKFIFSLAFAALIIGCAEAPKSDEAEVEEAVEIEEAPAEAVAYNVNTSSSKVLWVGSKPIGDNHNGTISISEGAFQIKDGNIEGGSITIDMNTLADLDIEDEESRAKLEGHLKSGDFFDVENFPTAKFELSGVAPYEAPAAEEGAEEATEENPYKIENPTHTITGNLTLHGETKSITFPAEVKMEGNMMMAKARFNINRADWGVSYGADESLGDKMISKTVNVGFDLEASAGEM
ncbi:MAG: YceI family protein [Bacteroidota bacterium]